MSESGSTEAAEDAEVEGRSLQLRFMDDEGKLHSLNATQMAEVLEGLVSLVGELAKARAFGDGPPPEVRVEPPKEGSFVIGVLLDWYYSLDGQAQVMWNLGTAGILGQAINVGTKTFRAEVTNYDRLENGLVKLHFSDSSVAEVSEEVWRALNKSQRRTKKNLRKVMAPLGGEADAVEITATPRAATEDAPATEAFAVRMERDDYRAVAHDENEVQERVRTFEGEGQLTSVDFTSAEKWRVSMSEGRRGATVEDSDFLERLNQGLALRKDDIFWLKIREESEVKNGRLSRNWFIENVEWRRRGGDDDDDSQQPPASESETT